MSLWKDYYLEHKERLDEEVSRHMKRSREKGKEKEKDVDHVSCSPLNGSTQPSASNPVKTAKKPMIKIKSSPSPEPPAKRRRHSKPSTSYTKLPPKSGRKTMNSFVRDQPLWSEDMPPPNSEIEVPEPPPSSPIPPTIMIAHNRGGYKFTPEDKTYFIQFLSWKLKHNPKLTRHELCEMLAQKVPHHTDKSWYSYWQSHHDLPDKILAKAGGWVSEPASGQGIHSSPSLRPSYKDVSTDEESNEEDYTRSDHDASEESLEVEGDNTSIPAFDESAMGTQGAAFTEADLAITARYVSTFENWSSVPSGRKWRKFGEKYPQRTGKSWGEYYRRNERAILKLAGVIQKKGLTTASQDGYLEFGDDPLRAKRTF